MGHTSKAKKLKSLSTQLKKGGGVKRQLSIQKKIETLENSKR